MAAEGVGSGDTGRIEEEIAAYQRKQGAALAVLVSKLTTYACRRLEDYFDAPIDQIFFFLEENPDVMDYKILDDEINCINNMWLKFAVNALIRGGGTILKQNNGWRQEFLEQGETILLAALRSYNAPLYETLKDNRKVVGFIKDYIAYKLGL